jgi:hypothetical protein
MNARISEESKTRPCRWGEFPGAILIPWSLVIVFSVLSDLLKPRRDPWYLTIIGLLMGLLGLPLAYGLLRKKAFALMLVSAMFGFSLLLVAIQLPIAIRHFADTGDKGSAFFEAELLLMWLLSFVYYRRRRTF